MMPKLRNKISKIADSFAVAKKTSDYVCLSTILDDGCCVSADSDIFFLVGVDGMFRENTTPDKISTIVARLSSFFCNLDIDIVVSYYFLSRKADLTLPRPDVDGCVAQLFDIDDAGLSSRQMYTQKQYFVFMLKNSTGAKAQRRKTFFDNLLNFRSRLEPVVKSFIAVAGAFSPKIIKEPTEINDFFSNLLTGEGRGERNFAALSPANLIGDFECKFDNESASLTLANGIARKVAVFGVKEFGSNTSVRLFDQLRLGQGSYTVCATFQNRSKMDNMSDAETAVWKLRSANSYAETDIDMMSGALDALESNDLSVGFSSLSVCCYADSDDELAYLKTNTIPNMFSNASILGLLEKKSINLQAAYWGVLPTNYRYVVRKHILSSENFSDLCFSMSGYAGRAGSKFGEKICYLRSPEGRPVAFNWHNDAGNGSSIVIGPMGSGKTLAQTYLALMSFRLSKKPKIFMLDYTKNCPVFFECLGAKTLFANSEVTPTNPFAIDDKPENRIFVKQFLLLLAESGGFAVGAKEQREIDSCIDVLFLQEKENRSLAVALSGLHESALSRFLQKWLDGEKSSYFNGRDDLCSVDEDFFYIDMTDILKDRELYPAYILYLLNRIKYAVENNVDGRPIFIFIEEAWRYLSIPEIQVELNALVPVLRRQGGLIVFITQSLNQLTENINLTRNIVNNSQNILVFRSDELERGAKTKNLMDLLEIKDTEYEAFVQRQPSERFFLYKDRSNNNSALCKVDLRGMEKILPILSANAEKNRFFYEKLYGKIKPEFALKEYLQNF